MISLIVAIDEKMGIGCDNHLLEAIPEDLQRFKELTFGHTVIMGRKTWDSLPKKPLPNRKNIVISSQKQENFMTTAECLKEIKNIDDEIFVIGGESIYRYFLPMANKIYITLIHKNFDKVDAYFPDIKLNEWNITERKNGKGNYTFITLERICDN